MSVVDLHPEELLDKWARGELSASERTRLDMHVEICPTCRLELELRRDFELEAAHLGPSSMPERLLAGSLAAPRRAPRRSARVAVWGLAAAGLVAATAAVASGWTRARSWQSHSDTVNRSASLEQGQPAPRPQASARSGPTDARQDAAQAVPDPPPHLSPDGPLTDVPNAHASHLPARAPITSHAHRAESSASLFVAANLARRQGELSRATELYRTLQTRFPNSEEAQLSLVTFAKLQLDRGNAADALGSFEQYVDRTGEPLEAEALVGRATALERLGRRGEAVAAWRSLVSRYPASTYARQATERLSTLSVP
jgi:TolA-binding protein